jgi:TonB family protein
MRPNIDAWLVCYVLNSAWQVPLLFAAGWLVARILRPFGAGVEHRLWVAVLFLQALLPVVSTISSQMWASLSHAAGQLFASFFGGSTSRDAHVSVVAGAGYGHASFRLPSGFLIAIVIAYLAATAYFTARFLWRCLRLRSLRRTSTPIALTGQAAHDWEEFRIRFGVQEALIATASGVRSPVTIGLQRKLLLLPVDMVDLLAEADLRTVIAHELAHMRRNDFFKNLIYELVALPISYHPVLRFTRERIMETRELVCDEMAAPVEERKEYTRSLLRLASLLVARMPVRTPHAIGILDANAFERRLMRLAQQPVDIRRPRRFALIFAAAALGITACTSALALRLPLNTFASENDNTTSKAPTRLKVAGEKMAGNLLSKTMPVYPAEAKEHRIQGTVALHAIISKDGEVEQLMVLSGPQELQQSSLDAVRQWTYKPFLLNGNPIEVETTINVTYSLAK